MLSDMRPPKEKKQRKRKDKPKAGGGASPSVSPIIAKIAKKTKLKPLTIWRYLTGKAKENRETSQKKGARIRAAADKYGYRPTRAPRADRLRRVGVVAFADGWRDEFVLELTKAMATSSGQVVTIGSGQVWPPEESRTRAKLYSLGLDVVVFAGEERASASKEDVSVGLDAVLSVEREPTPKSKVKVTVGADVGCDIILDEASGISEAWKRIKGGRGGWIDAGVEGNVKSKLEAAMASIKEELKRDRDVREVVEIKVEHVVEQLEAGLRANVKCWVTPSVRDAIVAMRTIEGSPSLRRRCPCAWTTWAKSIEDVRLCRQLAEAGQRMTMTVAVTPWRAVADAVTKRIRDGGDADRVAYPPEAVHVIQSNQASSR